jgi:cysteine-rich repeat protein
MADGTVRCWGSNTVGELGVIAGMYQSPYTDWGSMPVISDVSALQVVGGNGHTCVRTSDGRVSCWGYNGVAHYSSASWQSDGAPFTTFADLAAVEITAGGGHGCARNGNGQVFCWGLNYYGELGDGTRTDSLNPSAVPGLSAVEISAGGGHTCARRSDGTVACWGDNLSGQLGDGTLVNQSLPVVVDGLTGAVGIAAGERHTCARLNDGTVACWGANEAGQLGDGSTVDRAKPAAVLGLTGVVEITAGAQHSCARLNDGRVVCWGDNDSGQLGNATTTASATPVEVVLPAKGDAGAAGTRDSGSAVGTPKGFLIVNATANTMYLDLGNPVKCRAQDASGWQACEFFGMYCLPSCQYIQPGEQCCVACEQQVPSLLAVPAGGNRTVAWTGSLSAVRADYCSDCQCQEQSAVGQGTYEATVRVYDQYSCVWGQPCPERPDGTIPYAAPQGSFEERAVRFAIPSTSELVVITIPAELSGVDAALDSASSPSPDASALDGPVAISDAGLCGNGRVEPGEECDDGNTLGNDGCSSQCKIECDWMCGRLGCPLCGGPQSVCGNGVLNSGEQCDDGNVLSGDGCSESCQLEPSWICATPGRACVAD